MGYRMKLNIVIWGVGNQGKDAYYDLKKNYNIEGFLDSDSKKLHTMVTDGKEVIDFETNKSLIVLASHHWIDISKLLMEKGLRLFSDFIPYHMFNMKKIRLDELFDCFDIKSIVQYLNRAKCMKKVALIYGNCQTEIIANMLEYNTEFARQYMLLRVPQVHLYRSDKQIEMLLYSDEIMKLIDLFIFQNVREDNRYNERLGTNNIQKMLSESCRKLSIHNIYFDGYFIQYDANEKRYLNNMNEKEFPYTDGIVHAFVNEGKKVDEILALINDEKLVSQDKILRHCKKSIDNLRKREKFVDIHITDYIEKNYCNEQLFYTHNHPKDTVIFEYTKRILTAIGIDEVSEFTEEELNMEFGTLRINNFPIFPCVIKALGLGKYESKMRIFYSSSRLVTMDEYIKEYIFRCYQKTN